MRCYLSLPRSLSHTLPAGSILQTHAQSLRRLHSVAIVSWMVKRARLLVRSSALPPTPGVLRKPPRGQHASAGPTKMEEMQRQRSLYCCKLRCHERGRERGGGGCRGAPELTDGLDEVFEALLLLGKAQRETTGPILALARRVEPGHPLEAPSKLSAPRFWSRGLGGDLWFLRRSWLAGTSFSRMTKPGRWGSGMMGGPC